MPAETTTQGQEQQPRQGRFRASVIAALVGTLVVVAALATGLSVNGHQQRHGAGSTAATTTTPDAAVTPLAVPTVPEITADAATTATTTTLTPSTTTTTPADQVNSGLFFDSNKAPATDPITTTITTGNPPPLFGGLANNPLNAAFTGAAQRIANLGGLVTCYPKDGPELEKMVEGTSCTVILLTGGSLNPYKTNHTMIVKSPKVIIGHPIDLPRIQANKGVERIFMVQPGGGLDIRFVSLFRASGRSLMNGDLTIFAGGVMLVQLGGYARFTGVIFRDPPQTFQSIYADLSWPLKRKRAFGGHVLVLGGNFFCYGCQVIRAYPYGLPIVNVAQVGRDFLVVAGNCVTVGTYHIAAAPYLSSMNVGNAVAVLGGTAIRIGGGLAGCAVMVGQFGAGQNLFVGGGVLVNVGHQQQSVFALMMRAGMAMSAVGGGVLVHIAELENRMWLVACVLGAGQVYGVGGGILDKTGSEIANGQVSSFQALVGGSAYLGAGEMSAVGESFARVAVTADQHGLGLTWFNGAGDMNLIYVPSYVAAVVRSQFILGAEAFMGAGFVTNVNNTRWSQQVVNAGIPGYEGYVAAGAALFIRSRTFVRRRVNFRLRPFSWIVNGVGVGGAAIAQNNLYVDKDGIRINKPQPQKNRLLQAVEDAFPGSIARVTAAGGSGLLSNLGIDRPSFIMAESSMDSVKVNPPNPGILAKKIQEALASVAARRRLQGLPDKPKPRFLNVLAGLSPDKFMGAWKAAVEETAALANGGAARALADAPATAVVTATAPGTVLSKEVDADGRWPEYVWVGGGEKTQCRMCSVGPGKTADHWTSGNTLDTMPPPLTPGNETETATCQISEECSDKPLGSMGEVMAAVRAMDPSDPLVLPPMAQALFASKHTQRLLEGMHSGKPTLREDGIKLPDTNILSYEVNLYCQPGAASCDYKEADLKSVMKAYVDKTAPVEAAYKLTASSSAVPSALFDVVNSVDQDFISNTGSPSSDNCGQGVKFLVHLTVPDKGSLQNVTKLFDDTASNTAPLLDTLNSNQDQQFCDVTIAKRGALFFPALDTIDGAAFYQKLYTGTTMDSGALWPDVTVVAAHEVAPVQDAIAGYTYSILLEGFSMKQDVTVELFQGTAKTGTTVATVPGGMAMGDVRKVEWVAPAPDAAALAANDGVEVRAYIRAFHVGMPGVFAQSEVFNLEPSVGAQA